MSRALSPVQAILLALVVLVGLILGIVGLFAVGSKNWLPDAFHVKAGFSDIGGVEIGTRVRIQGMDAGEVESLEMPTAPGQPVLLKLRIAGKFRALVNQSARVQLASENLLSGKVIRIVPGQGSSQPVEDGTILASDGPRDLTAGLAEAASNLNRVLAQTESAVEEFRRGEGPVGQVTKELVKATARIDQVVARVDDAVNEVQHGKGTLGKLLKDEKLYADLARTVAQAGKMVDEIQRGEGTVGKLIKGGEMYAEAVRSLQDVRQMVSSVKQNSDAIKSMPLVRSYVVDVNKELNRPDCKRHRLWFAENKLFEPGKAVLTPAGRVTLDVAAEWVNERKEEGSEVLVAGFAGGNHNADFAMTLSQKQSEVVLEYLKSTHQVHRMGYWWWSNRTTKAVGCGANPSPVPETEKLPGARIELIVFVPQG